MAKNQNIETNIRDYIASNLDIVEHNLKLIDTEYYLKHTGASSGFVDILAQDEYNQFVVIEIKRSDVSARNSLNELFKYLYLLKNNYNVDDHDIRFIILSTTWHELLIPYSEFFAQTNLSIQGYQIDWVENEIKKKLPIKKLKQKDSCSFSPSGMVYLYEGDEARIKRGIREIQSQLIETGINDFIIIHLLNRNLVGKKFCFPNALYIAFQRMSEEIYFQLLSEDEINEISHLEHNIEEPENDYLIHIEDILLSKISPIRDNEEYGYPEKLAKMLTEGWEILELIKQGKIKDDPRIDDEALIRDIMGNKGTSIGRFTNTTKTVFRSRFTEIKESSKNCVKNNLEWFFDIQNIFKYIECDSDEKEIIVKIYNPPSLLNVIFQYYNRNEKDYLPSFTISIFNSKKNLFELFMGQLSWNGHILDIDSYLKELNTFKGFTLMRALSSDDFRLKTLSVFGLSFETFYCKNSLTDKALINGRLSDNWNKEFFPVKILHNGGLEIIESNYFDINELFTERKKEIDEVNKFIMNRVSNPHLL